jgi:hypothetical protein
MSWPVNRMLCDKICVVRSLWRHRESLVQMAAEHTMHRQQALSSHSPLFSCQACDLTDLPPIDDSRTMCVVERCIPISEHPQHIRAYLRPCS